ncbi:MAG: hypothetical protein E4G94_09335, partial [ANME-2 cluster archaeon]
MRVPGITYDELCKNCHGSGEVGFHGMSGDNVTCEQCHMGRTILDVTKMTSTSVARSTGTIFHTEGMTAEDRKALIPGEMSLERGTLEYNRSRCTICHDAGVDHNTGIDCTLCHFDKTDPETIDTWHSTNISGGGGPDCLSCHDVEGYAQHRINGSD